MKNFKLILSIIVGLIFCLSGFGKLVNVFAFQSLIIQYGLGEVHLLAPFIVIFEICAGAFFILSIYRRIISCLTFILTFLFTIAFSYAYIVNGITDCGCFGFVGLTSNIILFYVRNLFLIISLLFLFFVSKKEDYNIDYWKRTILITIMLPTFFIAGMTYQPTAFRKMDNSLKGKNVNSSFLDDYDCIGKSKQLLFFFSYSCPHCLNSIENYKSYIKNNVVDTAFAYVIIGEDEVENDSLRNSFYSYFDDILVKEIYKTELQEIELFPTAYLITNDTISVVIEGTLPHYSVLLGNK